MRLVEEEDELRFVAIADLGQILEELRHQPQEKARVQARIREQPIGGENVHHATPAGVGLQKIFDVEHRLAEESVASLFLELQQPALNGANRRLRDVAVLRLKLSGVVAEMLKQARRSLRSSSKSPLSSATLNASASTPSCVSLRLSSRARSSGPCRKWWREPDVPARPTRPEGRWRSAHFGSSSLRRSVVRQSSACASRH
jgi:hypothetical protein